MMLSKKPKNRCFVLRTAVICFFVILTASLKMSYVSTAAETPTTVVEIALYQGLDREKILIEGARKEGRLIFYTVHTWFVKKVGHEFEKKYPFIKVTGWRSSSTKLLQRIMAEYDAKRYKVDVFTATAPAQEILQREGILQE